MVASASMILGRAPTYPASTRSLPSRPAKAPLFPHVPITALALPRSFWTVTLAEAAVARAVSTKLSGPVQSMRSSPSGAHEAIPHWVMWQKGSETQFFTQYRYQLPFKLDAVAVPLARIREL
jgi:hypothetical protein